MGYFVQQEDSERDSSTQNRIYTMGRFYAKIEEIESIKNPPPLPVPVESTEKETFAWDEPSITL